MLYTYGSSYGSSYSKVPSTYSSSVPSMGVGAIVWVIIALLAAVVGGIVLYFTFLSKKNEGKFNGFVGWLYDFLRFDKMFIETLVKICYLIGAIAITLVPFAIITTSFLGFIFTIIFGNLFLRIIYELMLLRIQIWKNTTEIKKEIKQK